MYNMRVETGEILQDFIEIHIVVYLLVSYFIDLVIQFVTIKELHQQYVQKIQPVLMSEYTG